MIKRKEPETLNEFINNNDRLLATMGVFGALTAFFQTVNDLLSLLMLFIFLLLSLELYTQFPNWRNWREWNKGAINLFIFRISLILLVVGVVIYSFIQYQEFFVLFVIELSFICLLAFSDTLIPKMKNSSIKFLQEHERIAYVIGLVIAGVIAVFFIIIFLLVLWVILKLTGQI